MKAALLVLLLAQTRVASDFELRQMEEQVAKSHDFVSQLSGHLNLGDLHLTRSEGSIARAEYAKALDIATRERLSARAASDLSRYATATSYAGLASAKLGDADRAFALLEESIRYASDDSKTWNLYATAMSLLGHRAKAASAARNAVTIAEAGGDKLDLAVYRYTLASATDDTSLLETTVASLESKDFAPLREQAARNESFEIYSTARGDVAAYLSLLNRSQLLLASLYESHGDTTRARATYANVLRSRTDDPTALAALARLSRSAEDYAAAFDANPFSLPLVREYARLAASFPEPDDTTTGARVRVAIRQLVRGENRAARTTLDALLRDFPDNETLRTLRREAEGVASVPAFLSGSATEVTPTPAELRALIALLVQDRLTPEQHRALDRITFVGPQGRYRILGVTAKDGADALLTEAVP